MTTPFDTVREALQRLLYEVYDRHSQYALTALAALDDIEAENKRLRETLSDAADDIESWGAYASAFFQKKHDLEGCVAKYRAALESKP